MVRSTASGPQTSAREALRLSHSTLPYAKLLYTPEEAAELLSISRSRLYILLARSVIFSFKEGRARLIPMSALDQYVQYRLAEQASPTAAGEAAQITQLRGRER